MRLEDFGNMLKNIKKDLKREIIIDVFYHESQQLNTINGIIA